MASQNNNDDARRAEVSGWSARAAADWLASQGVDAAIVASARAHDVDGSELTLWHDDPAECDAAVNEVGAEVQASSTTPCL